MTSSTIKPYIGIIAAMGISMITFPLGYPAAGRYIGKISATNSAHPDILLARLWSGSYSFHTSTA